MKNIFIITLFTTLFTNAQDSTWKKVGNYSLSGNYIHVNSVKQQIFNTNISQEFNRKKEYQQFFINYTYLVKNDNVISNDLNFKFQRKKKLNNWNLYNYLIYSKLKSRSVLNREEVGLGIGREIINNKIKLNISLAIDYSITEFINKTINNLRLSNRIYSIINFTNFNLNSEIYIQPDIKDFNNLNYNWLFKLNIPLNKNFIFNISSVRTYETKIVNDNSNMNDNLLIGLTYKY